MKTKETTLIARKHLAEEYYKYGMKLFKEATSIENVADASIYFNSSVNLNPNNIFSLTSCAYCLLLMNQQTEVLPYLNKVLELNSSDIVSSEYMSLHSLYTQIYDRLNKI